MISTRVRTWLHVLPANLFVTTLTSMITAMIIAWSYGLQQRYPALIIDVIFGTIVVVASLAVLASLIALAGMLWHCKLGLLIALPLGIIHGASWSMLVTMWYRSIVSDFALPISYAWIGASICGLFASALSLCSSSEKLITSRITTVGLMSLLIGFFGPGLLLASCLTLFLLDDATPFDQVSNPDHRITALLIADDCGATCSCEIRVDLETDQQYVREVYRTEACDLWATWQSTSRLQLKDDRGKEAQINVQDFGITP